MSTIYYTGKGDDGTTRVLLDKRVSKDDRLIEAIGNVDELNSAIGVVLSYLEDPLIQGQLRSIQNNLFVIGAGLAAENDKRIQKAMLRKEAMSELESYINDIGKKTPELKKFVLPGGLKASSHMQLARAVARRSERSVIAAAREYKVDANVIAYLNRLSSYLFAAALYINHIGGVKESNPTY